VEVEALDIGPCIEVDVERGLRNADFYLRSPVGLTGAGHRTGLHVEDVSRLLRKLIDVGEVGAFLEPTILTNVTRDNPAYNQEFFGPVALVFPAKDEEEAIAIANDSPFGLGGSVYTSDIERGKRVARRIESGMVFINYPYVSAPELPFGGIKRSGYGKELSSLGIEEFVNRKLIVVPNFAA